MNLGFLTQLAHHRWNVAIVAELHLSHGAKFVTLANRLGPSHSTLTRCLAALIDLGMVRRNPGYGHPMRPEYLLTARGEDCGPACLALVRRLEKSAQSQVGFNKWSLPLVAAIGTQRCRFGELRQALPGISPRALTLSLKELEALGWLRREVTDDYPPRTEYRLQRVGLGLWRVLRDLADSGE